MMNKKTLVWLGVVCVVAIAAAIAIDHSRKPVSEHSAQAGNLVDDLAEQINDVIAVKISTPGQQSAVTLERGEKGWVVADKGGYPADVGKLREYLLRVADSSLIEQKTASRERYADLGVADLSEPDAKGIQVAIEGLAKPVDFIAGVFNTKAAGTYVRRNDEAQSWLAKGNLIADRNAKDWLQKDLANINADRIASVTITQADGKTLRVFKNAPEDTQYSIADLPKGREPVSDYAASGLASALADLRIDDVAPVSDVAPAESATRVRFTTFEGINVDGSIWTQGDIRYASFVASLEKDLAEQYLQAAQQDIASDPASDADDNGAAEDGRGPDEPADADEDAAETETRQSLPDLESEVARLNSAFNGWSFVLPAHKISSMTKTMDEMLKPLEEKASADGKKSVK
ncbi:DUF4340 domain-containing protein [Dokdonella sp.]|uniref:DUF4340 domain-containing protein n=1 Tax=Dokdonella sp. TaxID=2291710 RepID=UPI003C56D2CB